LSSHLTHTRTRDKKVIERKKKDRERYLC